MNTLNPFPIEDVNSQVVSIDPGFLVANPDGDYLVVIAVKRSIGQVRGAVIPLTEPCFEGVIDEYVDDTGDPDRAYPNVLTVTVEGKPHPPAGPPVTRKEKLSAMKAAGLIKY